MTGTLYAHISWIVGRWMHDIAALSKPPKDDDHAGHVTRRRAYARVIAAELRMVESVSHALRNGLSMTPVQVIWRDWLEAHAATYNNHPRLNEHENNAARRAALVQRETRLAALRRAA